MESPWDAPRHKTYVRRRRDLGSPSLVQEYSLEHISSPLSGVPCRLKQRGLVCHASHQRKELELGAPHSQPHVHTSITSHSKLGISSLENPRPSSPNGVLAPLCHWYMEPCSPSDPQTLSALLKVPCAYPPPHLVQVRESNEQLLPVRPAPGASQLQQISRASWDGPGMGT